MKKIFVLGMLLLGMFTLSGASFADSQTDYDVTDYLTTSGSAITVTPSYGSVIIDNNHSTYYNLDNSYVTVDLKGKTDISYVKISGETARSGYFYAEVLRNGHWYGLGSWYAYGSDMHFYPNIDNAEKFRIRYAANYGYTFRLRELEIHTSTGAPFVNLIGRSGQNTGVDGLVTVDVSLSGYNLTGASDLTVNYDHSKLEFVSSESINGQKIVYETTSGSAIRFITVSENQSKFISGSGDILRLNFKATGKGTTEIKVEAAKTASLVNEYDVPGFMLGNIFINIMPEDVNNDGVTNLVDLALMSWYMGQSSDGIQEGHYPDKDGDGIISEMDLVQILNRYLN